MLLTITRDNAVACRHMRYLSTNLTVLTRNARSRGTLISGNQFNQLVNRLTSIIGALMICAICDIKIHTAKLLCVCVCVCVCVYVCEKYFYFTINQFRSQ